LPKVSPLIVKPRANAFDNPDYLFELKYDGFRALLGLTAPALALSRTIATSSGISILSLPLWQSASGHQCRVGRRGLLCR
jgi:hypothetical protein